MTINFEHSQSAHCENGVVSNLLRFHGLNISEPMIFGIGSGLFFSYIPFLKLNGTPITSYRTMPGQIFSRACKLLGIKMVKKNFRSQNQAMDELDKTLEKGIPAGLQTSVYYLPYLPAPYRFHFNAHNIVVYGKENGHYMVSDPIMDDVSTIAPDDLLRARYAKGPFAPKGKMYFPVDIPEEFDLKKPILKGIKKTAGDMLNVPIPIFGVRGIRFLSKQLRKAPKKYGERKARYFLGNLIRMQEEIGTGGAGFRFIFAAFLQEAATILEREELDNISKEMTENGDRWREFAYLAGKICKGRAEKDASYNQLADIVADCAEREKTIFKKLLEISV
ncbi:MAG: peptidase [Flavobacteriales bacterium]|nr:BtrH N-terminal domain-containing protein [Bacteroidales bacterium AH-315-I05]PCJ85266.1 MAG: peptidase [Flavobacteriales bacterium]